MNAEQIKQLLEDVKAGAVNIEDAISRLRHLPFEDLGFARIDHHRHIRCGFPEVIYCPGKTTGHIIEIFQRLAQTGHNVMATRAGKDIFDAMVETGKFDGLRYEELARIIVFEQQQAKPAQADGFIAIVTAGTADMPVAMAPRFNSIVLLQLNGRMTPEEFRKGLALAQKGISEIYRLQREALKRKFSSVPPMES